MKRLDLRIGFLLFLASILCAVSVEGQTSPPAPVVKLKRTQCRGACSVYEVSIFADGTVSWDGKLCVATVGTAAATVPGKDVEELVRAISASGFSSFNDSYYFHVNPDGTKMAVTDHPTTFLTFAHDGVTKTVVDYAFAPDELHEIEWLVDRVSNSHRWQHDESGKLTLESIEPSYHFTTVEDLKNEPIVMADIRSQTKPGFTKLMQAAGKGDTPTLLSEIKSGADVNATDETGWTALMMAAVTGQSDALSVLLEHGAQLRSADKNGDTALIGAAANPYLYWKPKVQVAVVQELIAAGADVNQANNEGETALMWGAKSGNPELVQVLLKAGANPEQRDRSGHLAAYHVQQWLSMRRDDSRRSRYEQTLSILQPSK